MSHTDEFCSIIQTIQKLRTFMLAEIRYRTAQFRLLDEIENELRGQPSAEEVLELLDREDALESENRKSNVIRFRKGGGDA